MLDKALIRENPDRVRRALGRRGLPATVVDEFLAIDVEWRAAVTALDTAKAERNKISAEFAKAKDKDPSELAALREKSTQLGERIKTQEREAAALDEKLGDLLVNVPNILADDVPDGADETANVQLRTAGTPPVFSFTPKPHWEIGERLGILDFDRGVRLARSRFTVLKGSGARLNRALIDFFLERNSGRLYVNEINTMPGFTEISMYPKLWQASGLSFAELVTRVAELGIERFAERAQNQTSFQQE